MIKLIKSSFYGEAATKAALIRFIRGAKAFSMGAKCEAFEKAFAKKQGRGHAVFVNSGSSANLVLIQALLNLGALRPGDRVGFSALTWATNVMPVIQLGLKPVAIDCDLQTLNVSPDLLKPRLHGLKALFLTNVLGFCDRIDVIRRMCAAKKIILLEDNCESLGSRAFGRRLGNFGEAATFSFFVGHHLSLIEGGMVCTDDANLRDAMVMARAHGWDRNIPKNKQARMRRRHRVDEFYAKYTFYDLAYNVRPMEIQAVIGMEQLKHWDTIVRRRAENFRKFSAAQRANLDFIPQKLGHMDLISNFAMPVVCRTDALARKYKKRFSDAGVEVRPIIAGDITRQPFYRKYAGRTRCPNSALIDRNGFYFGNNPEMTPAEIRTLCSLLTTS